jgi:hypothetical protein
MQEYIKLNYFTYFRINITLGFYVDEMNVRSQEMFDVKGLLERIIKT